MMLMKFLHDLTAKAPAHRTAQPESAAGSVAPARVEGSVDAGSASPLPPAHDTPPVIDPAVFEQIVGYLSSEKFGSYMNMLTARGEAILHDLDAPDGLMNRAAKLADDAHTIAGGAGMFGFRRLTDAARGFVFAIEANAPDVPDQAARLRTAIDLSLVEIRRRVALDRARAAG